MIRFIVGVSALALFLPSLSQAQEDHRPEEKSHPPAARASAAHPEAPRPAPAPSTRPPQGGGDHQAPAASPRPAALRAPQGGGHAGPSGAHNFVYMGHAHPTFHAPAFHYPEGYAYRRWGRGERLPLLFLAPEYVFLDYAALGLDPPPYGYEWVRYGPDLLLVQLGTGQVVEVVPGAIY